MNSTKQIWALFKFSALGNPTLFIYTVLFTMPMWFQATHSGQSDPLRTSLEMQLFSSYQSFIFIGLMAMVVFVPEMFSGGTGSTTTVSGTEFLLTRAIDRPLLLRARAALFYAAFLAPFLVGVGFALMHPGLDLREYQKAAHEQIMASVPGSVAAAPDRYGRSTDILLPNGNLLVEEWRLGMYVVMAVLMQLVIFLLYSLKWRRFWIIAAFMVLAFAPLAKLWLQPADGLSVVERLLFVLLGHQVLFWTGAILAVVLTQVWCERRFARMEF